MNNNERFDQFVQHLIQKKGYSIVNARPDHRELWLKNLASDAYPYIHAEWEEHKTPVLFADSLRRVGFSGEALLRSCAPYSKALHVDFTPGLSAYTFSMMSNNLVKCFIFDEATASFQPQLPIFFEDFLYSTGLFASEIHAPSHSQIHGETDASPVREDASLAQGQTLLAEEDASLAQGQAILAEEDTSLAQGQTLFAEEDSPLAQGQTLFAEEDASLAQGQTPLAEEDSSLSLEEPPPPTAILSQEEPSFPAAKTPLSFPSDPSPKLPPIPISARPLPRLCQESSSSLDEAVLPRFHPTSMASFPPEIEADSQSTSFSNSQPQPAIPSQANPGVNFQPQPAQNFDPDFSHSFHPEIEADSQSASFSNSQPQPAIPSQANPGVNFQPQPAQNFDPDFSHSFPPEIAADFHQEIFSDVQGLPCTGSWQAPPVAPKPRWHYQEQPPRYKDEERPPRPVFLYILILLNYALFRFMNLLDNDNITKIDFGAVFGPSVAKGEFWRFFSHMFLHASLGHLLGNLLILCVVGYYVTRIFGQWKMLIIYLLSGILGGACSYALSPLLVISLGASGAIFGLIGCLLYNSMLNRKAFHKIMGALLLLIAITKIGAGFYAEGIDNYGHIGGFLGGFLAAGILGLPNQDSPQRQKVCAGAFVFLLLLFCLLGWHEQAALAKVFPFLLDI